MRFIACAVCSCALLGAAPLHAQNQDEDQTQGTAEADKSTEDSRNWLDSLHDGLYSAVWRSAMHIDSMFGPRAEDWAYKDHVQGSITPAVFWSEHDSFDQKFRFNVSLPLPHLDERFDAFVGTFNRDEYVTEREQQSGAIAHQHPGGTTEEDETLFGIRYRPHEGGRFEADAGLRIASPVDPFVKGGYRYSRGSVGSLLLSLRETAFWQHSEGFGFTSRIDLARLVDEAWLMRWTGSATLSENTQGVHAYTALTAYRTVSFRRAIGVQLFTDGELDAPVPLGEYGIRFAYRQRIFRDWLIMEIRPSVTWPKDVPSEARRASWGIGIGFEMLFGNEAFQARPVTF
jgi:hypothetical protein